MAGSVWLWRSPAANLIYRWLGGRYSLVHCAFIVQDGTIWRTRTWVNIAVPSKLLDKDDFGYVLIVDAKSLRALSGSKSGGWVLGGDGELAEHPYYKVGRPGRCEGCADAEITYSTHTPQPEIERLTEFDFSCITRVISCKTPDDLMPAARPVAFLRWQQAQLSTASTCFISAKTLRHSPLGFGAGCGDSARS